MNRQLASLAEERAYALATIFLTRRDDFKIYRSGDDAHGVDLVVHLEDNNRLSERIFGVIIKYTSATRDVKKEGFDIPSRYLKIGTSIPIMILVFTMQSNEGFFKWLFEPVIIDERAKLGTIDSKNTASIRLRGFMELDIAALDTIASQINKWYDVRLTSATPIVSENR
jgi:hypothetical protein